MIMNPVKVMTRVRSLVRGGFTCACACVCVCVLMHNVTIPLKSGEETVKISRVREHKRYESEEDQESVTWMLHHIT